MIKKYHPIKTYSFFSRLLLLCTGLLCIFAIIASIIVGYLSHQYEKSQFLMNYDLAMANLSEAFAGHFGSFYLLAGKIIKNNQCDSNLLALLNSSSYDEVPASVRNSCISLLSSICDDHQYLRGFLVYSQEKELLYYYTDSKAYLSHSSEIPELPRLNPFYGTKLDNRTLEHMIQACTDNRDSGTGFFGFAATLYQNPSKPLGYLIPLFSTLEFDNILSNYRILPDSSFCISDREGGIYFQSNPFSDQVKNGSYTNIIHNAAYGFDVAYSIPRLSLPPNAITYIIVIFALIVTLFSFGLYYLSYYLSHRNINHILNGMQHFSGDNLTYRIQIPRGRHEFTQIIQGFNDMCETLQRNVERSYVYELQQKKSELYALQTSINPHFLYNTLEMIRGQIVSSNSDAASQMILLLSKIYRKQTNTNMFVTLEDEVELCENLMILYQYRFQNFDYDFEIDEDAERFALPKNTLQPLIENYFVHGIASDRQDNFFRLRAVTETSLPKEAEGPALSCRPHVRLTLSNNGHPIAPHRLADLEQKLKQNIYTDKNSDGFALTNVRNRLRIAFEEDCLMTISTGEEGMNFRIELIFPAVTPDQLQSSFV